MDFQIKERYDINDLIKIVQMLRDPVNGCPWEKVQTHLSIRKNFIEETKSLQNNTNITKILKNIKYTKHNHEMNKNTKNYTPTKVYKKKDYTSFIYHD